MKAIIRFPWLYTILILSFSTSLFADKQEYFILWGGNEGDWSGTLKICNGQFLQVQPYHFSSARGDTLLQEDTFQLSWQSTLGIKQVSAKRSAEYTSPRIVGLHIIADVYKSTVLQFRTQMYGRNFTRDDFSSDVPFCLPILGS